MPNCFQLFKKGEKEPTKFHELDAVLCRELGNCKPDENKWFRNWYNTIGLLLALGKSFNEIILIFEKDNNAELLEVAEYLNKYYTSSAWYEHK